LKKTGFKAIKKKLIIISLSLLLIGSGLLVFFKYDRLINFYRYVIYDEPYVNRTFQFSRNVLSFDNSIFNKVRYSRKLDDSRGHFPNFLLPLSQQLTVKTSEQGLISYKYFLERYLHIINSHKRTDKNISDKIAFQIMKLVNEYFEKNQKKTRLPLEKSFLSEKDYRSEDFVYYVVNEKTGCGETGEAMVSLLRGAGFKARLLRFSGKPNVVMANHIIPEFYSENNKRWIMLEPMLNASPRINIDNISAMEMLASTSSITEMNKLWKSEFYYKKGVMWFNQKGLITNYYYFSGSTKSLKTLNVSINHGP
jgi:hypothetical protein